MSAFRFFLYDRAAADLPGNRRALPHNQGLMIYLTQLVYVRPGEEETFREFEDAVLPLLAKYGGELLLR